MARRNPLNERYGKHTAPPGKTRKSASSAKPKRSAGASSGTGKGSSSKSSAAVARKRRPRLIINPPTPEFKLWRRIWWAFLVLAMVLSTAAFFMWRNENLRTAGNWVLGIGYAMIFVALGIDWLKLRPMRSAWLKSGGANASEAKPSKAKSDDSKSTPSAPGDKS